MSDCLIELGTEELPPKALKTLSEAFTRGVSEGLQQAGLSHGGAKPFATPRRLAMLFQDIQVIRNVLLWRLAMSLHHQVHNLWDLVRYSVHLTVPLVPAESRGSGVSVFLDPCFSRVIHFLQRIFPVVVGETILTIDAHELVKAVWTLSSRLQGCTPVIYQGFLRRVAPAYPHLRIQIINPGV